MIRFVALVILLTQSRFRLLALDLDGTLLGPAGEVTAATARAIARLIEAGVRPVLCTGRRPRRTIPVARRLGLTSPLVCNSGALIQSGVDRVTLWRADLDRAVVDEAIRVCRSFDQPTISFLDRADGEVDYVVATPRMGRPLFDNFLEHNERFAEVDPAWETDPGRVHYHLTAIDTREAALDLERALHEALNGQIQTFVQKSPSYAGTMCEILRSDANKWTAIRHLCDRWEIDPSEVCAVGDDMNDIPMIRGAGLGVAMGHAQAAVRDVADMVVGTNEADGVAQLINDVILA